MEIPSFGFLVRKGDGQNVLSFCCCCCWGGRLAKYTLLVVHDKVGVPKPPPSSGVLGRKLWRSKDSQCVGDELGQLLSSS